MHASSSSPVRTVAMGLLLMLALLAAGAVLPNWLSFVLTIALAQGLVALGIVLLMRCGVVSFGQGLVFAAGGYAAALASGRLGISDGLLLALLGGTSAAAIAAPFSWLIARYRGIFFAMLSLALSMVLYGVLLKSQALGGSDGFNIARPTLFGWQPGEQWATQAGFALTACMAVGIGILVRIYFDSARGLVALAARDNEIRVEYLGSSVQSLIASHYIAAAFTGGVGGALAVMALGHVEPEFSYWTRSGDFVFIAILAGHHSVLAAFVASAVLELVRSFSGSYFPNSWQLVLGIFLLAVIRFLPGGLGSLWSARRARGAQS